MCDKLLFLIFSFSFVCAASNNPVPFITKCKASDSKCITEETQKAIKPFANGIPELGVEQMDPMVLKTVDASTPNLKLLLDNMKIDGMKNCEAKDVKRDVEKDKLFLKIQCTVHLEGHYDMDGKLLFIPIKGNGKFHADLSKILINAEVDIDVKDGKDGKKHWSIKKWEHTFDLKDKSHVEFEDLFEGNDALASAAKEMIANNGNDIIRECGPPIVKAVVHIVVTNVQSFFSTVALEHIVLN